MVKSYILSNLDINYILNLPQVLKAKQQIDSLSKGTIYFSIELTHDIKLSLYNDTSLPVFLNTKTIPMRWIKGDTVPHIDTSTKSFDTTFLAYLTNSQGQLLIDGISYPISKLNAYLFSEGLLHQTIETGIEPRLLLGPMSEDGLSVGGATTITANGQTEIIYIRYDAGTGTTYKINNGSYNGISLPLTIVNSNISYTLQVLFENDLILTTDIWFIICGSENIQFGSTSLKTDGTRPRINIEDVYAYPGFIRNGDSSNPGNNNIYIFNLEVRSTGVGNTFLSDDNGWIGQSYFGRGATNNYIINCFSDGDISENGGGILGAYSGSDNGSELYIFGCSSSGVIGNYAGGITGAYTGTIFGDVTCKYCFTNGAINGVSAGGIYGIYAADNNGFVRAIQCYSLGAISGLNSGGIYGQFAGNASTAEATKCYSQGAIAINTGGIFGGNAGSSSGITPATNCYSSETYITLATGIYGPNAVDDSPIQCYSANGSWSDTTANNNLTGTPNPVVGTTWVASGGTNYPYELNNMGYSPYSITNIVFEGAGGTPILKQTNTQTISAGESSSAAIRPGYSYDKMSITGGDSGSYASITVDSNSGVISTTSSTTPGAYTITIRNTGSYNLTTFSLTVSSAIPISIICFPAGTPITTDQGNISIEKINKEIHTIRNNRIVGIVKTKSNNDYLVCFEKDSLGKNMPNQKTIISSEHGIIFDGKMKKAKEFLKYFHGVYKIRYQGQILYNVLMEKHNTMVVNNLLCETLEPNNSIAKLYLYLEKCTQEKYEKVIEKYNKYIVEELDKKNKKMKMNHYISL